MDREETVLVRIIRRFEDKSEMVATYPFDDGESAHEAASKLANEFKKILGEPDVCIEVDEDETEMRFDDGRLVIISVIYQEHLTPDEIIENLGLDGFFLK